MGHLSKADLQALANQLAALKRQAQAEVDAANAEFAQDQADGDQDVGPMADEAEELRLHEVRHGELKLDLQTLAQIEAAQARMQEGLYGLCITCGQPIARERLFALPTAIRCTACQSQHEAGRH